MRKILKKRDQNIEVCSRLGGFTSKNVHAQTLSEKTYEKKYRHQAKFDQTRKGDISFCITFDNYQPSFIFGSKTGH